MYLNYLAYGSNLHPLRLQQRLGPVERLGAVRLPGRQLCFHKRGEDGSGKCNLVADPASNAWGVVYRIGSGQRPLLDDFEGEGYRVEQWTLSLDGGWLQCFTYIGEAGWLDDSLRPRCWYRDLVWHGALHAGFPGSYVDSIRYRSADADHSGRRRHQELLVRMAD